MTTPVCTICGEPRRGNRHECNLLALQASLTALYAHTGVNYTVERWRQLCNSAGGLSQARAEQAHAVERLQKEGLG
jgi:hypothetical protein